ncbi:MAG: hypothetical protein QOC81_3057 [Thermoanaerobaculia bacterium]|nr:hypothetical protein [Thermoanaerobaculia bacterium]
MGALDPVYACERLDSLAIPVGDGSGAAAGSLPYELLGGAGFERLCYQLLVAEGHAPRFLGTSGQSDYGVDIVLEVEGSRTLLQCKNLKERPSFSDINRAVNSMKDGWLEARGLTPPKTFIYCCPQPLNDVELGIQWTRLKDEFFQATGVSLILWDKHSLDARLRNRPDIVAGLFSEAHAEFFCGSDRWRLDDPWMHVHWGEPRHTSLRRFVDRHRRKAIYVSEEEEERFEGLFREIPVGVVRGLPGTGKTSLVLTMAARPREPVRRIYYATMQDYSDPERLWQAARRRMSLPAIFVLDDCHNDLNRAALVIDRLLPDLRSSNSRLVLLLRDRPMSSDSQTIDDSPEWLTQAERTNGIMDLAHSLTRTRAVANHLRPDLAGLSLARLKRLHSLCAGDLLLLDESLTAIDTATELDTIEPEGLYASLRARYFGGNRLLPTIRELACLAQFDIVVDAAFLQSRWQNGERALAAPLMTELFAPPRYHFLHSSLAELVLRAQVALEVTPEDLATALERAVINALRSYLYFLLAHRPGAAGCAAVVGNLQLIFRTRPSLIGQSTLSRIAAALLHDDHIYTAFTESLTECHLLFLYKCASHLNAVKSPALQQYLDLIERRLGQVVGGGFDTQPSDAPRWIRFAFVALSAYAPERSERLGQQYRAADFLRLIAQSGTLNELLHILQWAPFSLAFTIITELDEHLIDHLIAEAVRKGDSMIALKFAMRAMRQCHPDLVVVFEQRFTADRMLRILRTTTTLHDLFAILEHSTSQFRRKVVDQLVQTDIQHLIDHVGNHGGRRVGWLHVAIRGLRNVDPEIHAKLEQLIGAPRFLELFLTAGSFHDLLRLMLVATPELRSQLLDRLDEGIVTALIERTIAAARPIGTLPWIIGTIGSSDPASVELLFERTPTALVVRLLLANGSFYEFIRLLAEVSPSYRSALLQHIDPPTAERLVQRAIAADRSLAALSFALGKLYREDPQSLAEVERRIGAPALLRLIVANGTLFVFFEFLQFATPDFHTALMAEFLEVRDVLARKTISRRPSIASIVFGLEGLKQHSPELLIEIQRELGVEWFFNYLTTKSNITDLFQIFRVMPTLREPLLDRIDDAMIEDLIEAAIATRHPISAALSFTIKTLQRENPAFLTKFEGKLGAARFLRLILSSGSLLELFYICHHSTPAFVSEVFNLLDTASGEVLISRLIERKRSIETLHYLLHRPLDQRVALERAIGCSGWWRVVRELGTLRSLPLLAGTMSDTFRAKFIDASVDLECTDWSAIVLRGQFAHVCAFLDGFFVKLPGSGRKKLLDAMAAVDSQLIAFATWVDLNAARPPTGRQPYEARLRELYRLRMVAVDLTSIPVLDFEESLNALACIWRERLDLRAQLVSRWNDLVPQPASWPTTGGEIAHVRFGLDVARSPEVPKDIALRLLHEAQRFLTPPRCAGVPTAHLLLIAWHLAAIHFERNGTNTFEQALPRELCETLLKLLSTRSQRNGLIEERIAQFGLAAILAQSCPQRRSELQSLLKPLSPTTDRVRKAATDEPFVPAFFALQGISLLRGATDGPLNPLASVGLIIKSRRETDGPALRYLLRSANLH